MAQMSNAEKQARFRKKEHLKRRADNIFFQWQCTWQWRFQLQPDYFKSKSPEDIKYSLDKAISLPSGWTDEDYERAEKTLDQLRKEFHCGLDQITYDVDEAREDLIPCNPTKLRENDIAIENARALAAHVISALKLSSCSDAEQAAALMEGLRFVGRSLSSQSNTSCSQATAMSLASISREYDRPEWFAKKLADTISAQVGSRLASEVGQHLTKNNKDNI